MHKALIVKPETIEMLTAILANLPEVKTGYVRLLGPGPGHVFEREFHSEAEQNDFLVEFGLGRLWKITPEIWMRRNGSYHFRKETLKQAEQILRWAKEYHRLAQEAAAR